MLQEPIVFTNRGQRLFGMIHLPGGEGPPPHPALVMLHGFTGHHIEPHRLFVKAARRFASEGIVTLRFDFRCCGDSEGDFEDLTIAGLIDDARAALRHIGERDDVDPSRVGLLGFSLGGAVAARATGLEKNAVRCLVLWAAVADLGLAFKALAPISLAEAYGKRSIHDYRGNALSQVFLEELLSFRPLRGAGDFAGPALILHGENDAEIPVEDAETYRRSLGGDTRSELHVIKGADHIFSSLSWEKELISTTAEFLKKNLFNSM